MKIAIILNAICSYQQAVTINQYGYESFVYYKNATRKTTLENCAYNIVKRAEI